MTSRNVRWSTPGEAVRLFLAGATARTAVPTALIVGTILSAVNQGGVLLDGRAGPATGARVGINYLVPFLVASVGYLSARRVPAAAGLVPRPVAAVDGGSPALVVVSVSDCPHVAILLDRIRAAGVPEGSVRVVETSTRDQAAAWAMTGSPTLLIDGEDPWVDPAAVPALGCRLSFGAHGDSLPTTDQIAAAIAAADRSRQSRRF